MLEDLGYKINQENRIEKQKTVVHLVYDIVKLCISIKEKENRETILKEDVNKSNWCSSYSTYDKIFKAELGCSATDIIKKIGFERANPGMGMIFTFGDGETTGSQWEFMVSNHLRKHNIKYERNVPYSDFIPSYAFHKNPKDCDYVIKNKGNVWYIEIAGMLDQDKINTNKDDKIRKRYRKSLKEKERFLIENRLNYKIIYPEELRSKSLEELFSFLEC